jgi:hypothetical protein
MSDRMLALRQRRGELVARIDVQRGQLAEIASTWEGKLAVADQGIAIVRFFRTHPLLLAGLSVLIVVRRRGIAGLIRSALLAWKGYRLFTGYRQKL